MVTKAGDIIEIELNLTKKVLSCKVNGKDVEETISNLKDGKYRLSVHMYMTKQSLS